MAIHHIIASSAALRPSAVKTGSTLGQLRVNLHRPTRVPTRLPGAMAQKRASTQCSTPRTASASRRHRSSAAPWARAFYSYTFQLNVLFVGHFGRFQ